MEKKKNIYINYVEKKCKHRTGGGREVEEGGGGGGKEGQAVNFIDTD